MSAFVKGPWKSGERMAAPRLAPNFELVKTDNRFFKIMGDGVLQVELLLDLPDAKPYPMHLILTGRGAHPQVLERAHLVTEMTAEEHPYQQRILTQEGVDF